MAAGSDSVLPLSRKSSLKLWNDENEAPFTMAKRIENNSPQNTTQKTIDKAI
jgi:hypothetical protein